MQQQNTPISTLAAQLVPTSPELLQLASYREFLRVRREALAARMNQFISEAAALPEV